MTGAVRSGSAPPDLTPTERSVATERLLVLAYQHGDSGAFDELYRRYHGHAERVCLRVLLSKEDAEEAAQETMVRVLRGLPALAGDYAVRPWIERIAANVAIDALRARRRRPVAAPATATDTAAVAERTAAGDPSDVVEAMVRSVAVREALAAMPEPHRAALVLREVEGRSHVEIGDALGISTGQAKALVHRARRRFQQDWPERRRHLHALAPLLLPARIRDLIGDLLHPAALPRAAAALAPVGGVAGPAERLATAVAALALATGVGGPFSARSEPPPSPAPAAATATPLPPPAAPSVATGDGAALPTVAVPVAVPVAAPTSPAPATDVPRVDAGPPGDPAEAAGGPAASPVPVVVPPVGPGVPPLIVDAVELPPPPGAVAVSLPAVPLAVPPAPVPAVGGVSPDPGPGAVAGGPTLSVEAAAPEAAVLDSLAPVVEVADLTATIDPVPAAAAAEIVTR